MLKKIISKMILLYVIVFPALCHSAAFPSSEDSILLESIGNSVRRFDLLFLKYIKDELKPEENALFSPFNIHTALSLLHLGTNGETRNELSHFLEIPSNETGSAKQHGYLGKVLNDLQTTDKAEVKIANSVFVQQGLKLKDSYLQATKNYYKNEARQVNFTKAGSEATDIVNSWVSNNTKKRIPKLFKESISHDTKVLLISALFFNATWQKRFEKWGTRDEKFNTGVKQVAVQMMNQQAYVPYLKNEKLQIEAISLPYKDNEFWMDIILPYGNRTLNAVVDDLKSDYQLQTIQELHSKNESYVDYKLPRFKFDWSQNINKHIQKSGINKIFEKTELDNLVEGSKLSVSDINHATEIQVDEDGTIAAAVTAIQVSYSFSFNNYPEPIKFYVDRPFLFRIIHQKTGIILFTGIVQNPSV